MKKLSYLAVAAIFAVTFAFTACNDEKTAEANEEAQTEQVEATATTTEEVVADSTQTEEVAPEATTEEIVADSTQTEENAE